MSREYKSSLAGFLSSYVNYRQRGGLSFKSQERILASFDAYLAERRHSGPLSPETIDAFLDSRTESLCIGGRWRFRQVVSQFYDYLGVYYTGQRRLPKGEARVFRQRPAPRIFTEEELAAMLNAAKHISRHNKIRNMTFHAALAVAIACGLRAGEVVRIHIEDIDFQTSRLTVRKTKFGKSRIIPIGSDLLATLGEYLAYRRSDYPGIISDHLFVTMHGQAATLTELAAQLGGERTFIYHSLELVNLAPDIQKAIIGGRIPDGFTLAKLRKGIPDTWAEQREKFGFALQP